MKPGIIITAMAALALTVFAAGEVQANWWGWGDVHQRLFGHTIIVEQGPPNGLSTSTVNGIAKGKPGRALVTSVLVFREPDDMTQPQADPRCDKYKGQFPFFSEITRFEWGETYNDGSLLSGFLFPPGQGFCSDGILSVADLTGLITGGTGRFEDASGDWRIEASSPTANTTTTGTLKVDFASDHHGDDDDD